MAQSIVPGRTSAACHKARAMVQGSRSKGGHTPITVRGMPFTRKWETGPVIATDELCQ